MRLSTVLFDLDGVLVNTLPLMRSAYAHIAACYGYREPSEEVIRQLVRLSPRQALRHLVGVSDTSALEEFVRYCSANSHLVVAFEGIPELLKRLRSAGLKVGVVTARNRVDASRYLRVSGLDGLFDTVVVFGDYKRKKPAPDGILVALSRLASRAQQSVYVGDQTEDIMAAQRAGCLAIMALWGGSGGPISPDLQGSYTCVNCPEEIYMIATFKATQSATPE